MTNFPNPFPKPVILKRWNSIEVIEFTCGRWEKGSCGTHKARLRRKRQGQGSLVIGRSSFEQLQDKARQSLALIVVYRMGSLYFCSRKAWFLIIPILGSPQRISSKVAWVFPPLPPKTHIFQSPSTRDFKAAPFTFPFNEQPLITLLTSKRRICRVNQASQIKIYVKNYTLNILEPLPEHPLWSLQKNLISTQRSYFLHTKILISSYKFSPILS
jgi:hypothetical protein